MKCKLISHTGAESILYKELLEITNDNESKATALYSHFKNPHFINKFGDYVNDYDNVIFNERVDSNGEPRLFKDNANNRYYIDKKGNFISFPLNKSSIKSKFSAKDIKATAHYLGMEYLKNVRNVSLEHFDIDSEANGINIKDFILKEYEKRITTLSKNSDMISKIQSKLLEDTIDNVEEWVPYITKFFKTINISHEYNDETTFDELNSEDVRESDKFGASSFEMDSKRNVRTITKLKLATIEDPAKKNNLFGKGYVDYSSIYALLEGELNDNYAYEVSNEKTESLPKIVDIAENIINKLSELSRIRPELMTIAEQMNVDEAFRTSMVMSFKNQKNIPIINEINFTSDINGNIVINYSEKDISETASYSKGLRDNWNSAYYIKIFGDNVKTKSVEEASKIVEQSERNIQALVSKITEDKGLTFDENYPTYINEIKDLLKSELNIDVDIRSIYDYLGNESEGDTLYFQTLAMLRKINAELSKIRSTQIERAGSLAVTGFNFLSTFGVAKKLANYQALYEGVQSASNVRAGSKDLYLMSNINYLKNRVEVWKRNPKLLEDYYNNSDYAKSSEFIRHLLAKELEENQEYDPTLTDEYIATQKSLRLQSLSIAMLTDLFVSTNGKSIKEETAIKETSLYDYLVSDLNKTLTPGMHFRSITPADKSSNFQMSMGNYSYITFNGTGKNGLAYNINKRTEDTFFRYMNTEIQKMSKARDFINEINGQLANGETIRLEKLKVHYHYNAKKLKLNYNLDGKLESIDAQGGNAFLFQSFPGLNFIKGNPLQYKGNDLNLKKLAELEQNIRERLYENNPNDPNYGKISEAISKNGVTLLTQTVDNNKEATIGLEVLLRQYINMALSNAIARTATNLAKENIISINNKGVAQLKNIDSNVINRYKELISVNRNIYYRNMPESELNQHLVNSIVTDYTVKSIMNNIEYTKLFTGDPAYYKDMVDFKKRVPATYTDGTTLYLKPNEKSFNIAVIAGVIVDSPYHDRMIETYDQNVADKFKGINSTDAQAWITPKRWKFLQQRLGKWSPVHDSLYKKMMSGVKESYSNEELKIAAQPLKGVHFGLNPDGSPIYLKYSQAVLTPMLVKGNDLQKIYDQMTSQNVDELITLDGVKVGSPTVSKIHNADGSLTENLSFNVMSLSNLDWKLQQDLPTKTFKDTEVGSQIQKNIFAGLIHNPDMEFDYDGKTITGSEIMDEIVNEVRALSDKGLNQLFNEFGVDRNTNQIENVDRYYQALIDELIKRDGTENIIEALQKRMSIAGIPQARTKLNNMFASIVNKRIVKIKTNGGSFIQMSNFGLNYTNVTAEDSGIVLHPNFNRLVNKVDSEGKNITNHKYTSFEPIKYTDPETGRERISPGGVFISGAFIAKYIPNYKDYTAEQLFGKYENGQLVEEGMIDNRILESLVGYRIPNQGLASNDALQIVGILPEENGDTVVAYTGITTKTGSDFDIDKMYLMMPTYKVEDNKLRYIDSKNEDGYHQNRLIQLYKSVLTNPNIISDVMLPIDFNFMKTDIVDLTSGLSGDTSVPYYHMSPYEDIKLMYDFRNGKAGVGQEANWMVDINRRGIMSIKNFDTLWFSNSNPEQYSEIIDQANLGSVVLDREYSVNLNEQDVQEYFEDLRNSLKQQGLSNNDIEDTLADLSQEITDVKIASAMTAVLNGFVDIAKDPFITRGNWVLSTTNPANLLLRMGVHPLKVNAFLAQPILRQYAERARNIQNIPGLTKAQTFAIIYRSENIARNEDSIKEMLNLNHLSSLNIADIYRNKAHLVGKFEDYSNDNKLASSNFQPAELLRLAKIPNTNESYTEALNEAIELSRFLSNINQDDFLNYTSPEYSSLRDLRNNVKADLDADVLLQMGTIFAFEKYAQVTRVLTNSMKISKLDTDGIGDNIANMLVMQNSISSIINDAQSIKEANDHNTPYIEGYETKFNNSPLGVYYENLSAVYNIAKANPILFPSLKQSNVNAFNTISTLLTGKDILDTDLLKLIDSGLNQYQMSEFFNISADEKIDLLKNLPHRLLDAKDRLTNNDLIKQLVVKSIPATSVGTNLLIVLPNTKRDSTQQDGITQAWNDLLVKEPKLAEDLIKYSYVSTGFNSVSGQYFNLIPHEYLLEKDINRFVNTFVPTRSFIDQFVANNYTNSTISKYIGRTGKRTTHLNNGILSVEPHIVLPLLGNFIIKNDIVYRLFAVESNNVQHYRPIYASSIMINNNSIADYGDTITKKILSDKNVYDNETLQREMDNVLKDSQLVDILEDSEYIDYFTNNNNFIRRESRSDVQVMKNFTIKDYIDYEKGLIDAESVKEASLGNIFSATGEKGKININIANLTPTQIALSEKGKYDPRKLLSSQEYVSIAYSNWLFNNDDTHIPIKKREAYNKHREAILNSIYDQNSPLNQALNNGYKFMISKDTVNGVKYRSHIDLVAQKIQDIRQIEMNRILRLGNDIITDTNEDINIVENFNGIISRDIVRSNPKTLYLFGDNDIRKGLGGQAKEMRGEFNTIGISTKKLPNNNENAFKTDLEFEENKNIIDNDIQRVIEAWNTGLYNKIVIPQIGVGLAKLPEKAPKTFDYLQNKFKELSNLSIINNISQEQSEIDLINETITNSTNPKIIQQLQDYKLAVIESQTTMFPITKQDVEQFIKKCL